MTIEETRDILTVLKINYPQSFKGWDKQQGERFLQLWSVGLKDHTEKEVKTAVWYYIMETDSAFAPNIGQIRTFLKNHPSYYVDQLAVQYFPKQYKRIGNAQTSPKQIADIHTQIQNISGDHHNGESGNH